MENFTIHIFGYGETQINGDEFSVKVKTETLNKVQPLVSAIWALKPSESLALQDFHAINLFNYNDIRYNSKDGFSLKTEPTLKVLIDELIVELKSAYDAKNNAEAPVLTNPEQ